MSDLLERGDYAISTDRSLLDRAAIHTFLTHSYWSPGISRELIERAITNSLCFGIYHHARQQREQVGFARVISDWTTFAYLADVFVLEEHRGRGLSKWLVESILAHPDLQGLRRFMLATRDAHALYAQFGFQGVANPGSLMEILRPDVYGNKDQRAQ